uniref:Ribosomal protein S1 n=1 Tax=Prasinococcus sp. CCMP1194 TaxID=110672 RepID=A0A650AKN2_9VIRI|nr:ribosomal protein S1 [Prasinococcus sp. CCMP1194]
MNLQSSFRSHKANSPFLDELAHKAALNYLHQAFEEKKPLIGRYLTRVPGGFTVSIAGIVCFLPLSRSSMHFRQPPSAILSSNPKSEFFEGSDESLQGRAPNLEETAQRGGLHSSDSHWSIEAKHFQSLGRKRRGRFPAFLTHISGPRKRVSSLEVPFHLCGFMGQLGLFTLQKFSEDQIVVLEDFSVHPSFFL